MRSILLLPVIQEGLKLTSQPIPFDDLVDRLMERFKSYNPSKGDIKDGNQIDTEQTLRYNQVIA
jgi:hypothetical protein